MNTRTAVIAVIVLLLVFGAGWYTLSPLFRNIEVNEALPENIIQAPSTEAVSSEERVGEESVRDGKEEIAGETEREAAAERSPVMGTTGHPASGFVRVLETTSDTVIRYEDFETINGPNLHVYLAKDLDADTYVDLGPIKGTRGNVNYSVPNDVDISEYRYVLYWCVPFSVLFNYAEIR